MRCSKISRKRKEHLPGLGRMLSLPLFEWHREGKVSWRTDIKVENQINSPSLCSPSPATAQARYRRGRRKISLRASLAIICLWRKSLAVFIELAYVVKHGGKNTCGVFSVQMIFFIMCEHVPRQASVSVPPWGNESHRVITRCKMRMAALFIAASKQMVPGLLLFVLEEFYAFLKPSCSCLILPPPAVAAVSGRSRKENSTQPETLNNVEALFCSLTSRHITTQYFLSCFNYCRALANDWPVS